MSSEVTMPDGRVIRDLTDEEYDATYDDGEPEKIPDSVIEAVIAALGEDDD